MAKSSYKRITIDGNKFSDITTFYDEMEKLFTKNLDWKVAHNLDAFNDILYGGFGKFTSMDMVKIQWKNAFKSKEELGIEATKEWHRQKINFIKDGRSLLYNLPHFEHLLSELENNRGETFFEMVVSIIRDHNRIQLDLDDE